MLARGLLIDGAGLAGFRRQSLWTRRFQMIRRTVLLALLTCITSNATAADGDSATGKAVFERTCQNCHAVQIGVNKVGPSLWNIVGREPASVPDFAYSDAMKANKDAWTPSTLDAYLADPRGDLHGVKMFFKGLPDPKDRANVIAYLQTLK
jgi:cytochrome c